MTSETHSSLPKAPSGIAGLDEITGGGLPRGRTTLLVGGAGCGKTLLGLEFLICGVLKYAEPGVFVAFEETQEELSENVRSLGYDLDALIAGNKLSVDHIRVEPSEIEETGEYDLEGLFVRLAHAIETVGAKRMVIDTLEVLFAGLTKHGILRAEFRRLFRWLKEKGITAVVTSERGPENQLTRHGFEEYVSDCVIFLDHRIDNQLSTRRLRVLKYRGSAHGADEYPFLIEDHGIEVFPITSLRLDYPAPSGYAPTGIAGLDEALDGRGFPRGSSILVTGTAGTGKTSIAATFVNSACKRGERCLYLAMEESPAQVSRNMSSIGLDLDRWCREGRLQVESLRPTCYGLEMHLATVYRLVTKSQPEIVVMDPISGFSSVGSDAQVSATITRMLDFLKARQITAVFTAVAPDRAYFESSEVGVSSWVDGWIQLRAVEINGSRKRCLYIVKIRGMAHSDRIHELKFTQDGLQLGQAVEVRAET